MNEKEAFAFCERLTKTHYENFSVASFLLPRALRKPFYAVYAYCRTSDDLADESGSPERATELLFDWERQLDRCFEGKTRDADSPIFVALNSVVSEYGLSRAPFADLLAAFRRDQIQTRYENLDDLLDYCRCSADPVGRIILQLGAAASKSDPPTDKMIRMSDSICSGLQLANFWQDVARDWNNGRFYVPLDYCRKYDCDPTREPRQTPRFETLLRDLCGKTREMFRVGRPLVDLVPRILKTDIALFLGGGLAVLDAIEAIDYKVWTIRPVVTKWKKATILARSLFGMV